MCGCLCDPLHRLIPVLLFCLVNLHDRLLLLNGDWNLAEFEGSTL